MNTTQGEHAQTEAQPIQRFEVVDCIDSKHVPAVIPRKDGPWVRYEDHAAELRRLHAQVAALTAQPAAPQGVAYAGLQPAFIAVMRALYGSEFPSDGEFADDHGWSVQWAIFKAGAAASNRQAPQGVALPSDRELQEIAMQAAWRHSREPDAPKYLPRSPVHAATWKPHAWVVAAMKDAIEAATQPKKDHHDELS